MSVDFAGLALRANPDAIIVAGLTGVVAYWNPGAERLFGHAAAEAVGQPLRDLVVPPEQHDALRAICVAALRDGSVVYDGAYRRKDGAARLLCATCSRVGDAHGHAEYLLFTLKDVTALRLAVQAQALGASYGELLEAMPDGILLIASSGHIVYSNTPAEQMFGYTREQMRGSTVEQLLPERHRAAHVARRETYFAAPARRTNPSGDLYGLRRNGTEFPLEVTFNAVQTADGRLALAALRDVTERKRAELVLASRILALESAARGHGAA